MQKISKRQALSLIKQGKEVFIQSSKVHYSSIWQRPHSVELNGIGGLKETWMDEVTNTIESAFNKLLNSYHYYNCTKETGLRINYYTE